MAGKATESMTSASHLAGLTPTLAFCEWPTDAKAVVASCHKRIWDPADNQE